MFRMMPLFLAALALVCFAAAPTWADDKSDTYEGTFVKAQENKITIKDKEGKESVFNLEDKPTVTTDGTRCQVSDLKAGTQVRIVLGANRKVNKVEATDIHEGTFVKADANQLFMKDADGKEQTHNMIKDTPVTCNGTVCKASDLKPGFKIKVTFGTDKKVTKIEATSR